MYQNLKHVKTDFCSSMESSSVSSCLQTSSPAACASIEEEQQPITNINHHHHHQHPLSITTVDSNSRVDSRPMIKKKKNKNRVFSKDEVDSSTSTCVSVSRKVGVRVGLKRRNKARVVPWRGGGSRGGSGEMETIALPLGMSFAAVVAQVLERRDTASERISSDHLATICTSAVRESLANVFGDNFDTFLSNFEKSFGSTLRTLRLISDTESSTSGMVSKNKGACSSNSRIKYGHSEEPWLTTTNKKRLKRSEDMPEECMNQGDTVHAQQSCEIVNFQSDILKNERVCTTIDDIDDCQSETEHPTGKDVQETMSIDRGLILHGQTSQLVSVSSSRIGSVINQSMISNIEKSVVEQVRSNDLKTFELGLMMERMKLKERHLSLDYDSNNLKRSELAMGVSMASFKVEKFKNQVEDMRHSELLKMCIDCLVFGLFIMLASLSYGTYVFSYKRITEATAACAPFTQESKSWWIPKRVASLNTGLQLIMCQVQVLSRMLFGVLMILAIAYLLVQRSATSKQTMPLTFILLLLGAACGLAGKFCVDTLGGSGYHWVLHWEVLCTVHFISNIWTSALFLILYGPIAVSQGNKSNPIIPYWVRRLMFYVIVPLALPLFCGLMPFANPWEWKDHFYMLIKDLLWRTDELM